MQNHIRITAEDQKNINAYLDYHYNTGQDAAPFSEKEYKKFKQNQIKNAKNKVYTRWRNTNGKDCKSIGTPLTNSQVRLLNVFATTDIKNTTISTQKTNK